MPTTIHSGVASHSVFIPAMWANTALGILHRNAVMPRLVSREWEPIVATMGSSVEIPKRGVLTAQAKVVDIAVTPQSPTPSKVRILLDKHYCVDFLIEDVLAAQSSVKNMLGYIEDGMATLAKQVDTDLLSVYTAVPAAQIITRNTGAKTEADIVEARRILNANEVPDEDRYYVCEDYGDLLKIARYTEAHRIGENRRIIEGQCGRVDGFDVFEDPRVVQDATSAGIYNNLFFWKRAIALVTRPLALPPAGHGVEAYYAEKDGLGLRLIYGYDFGHRAMRCGIDILYGVGVVDTRGIVLYRV